MFLTTWVGTCTETAPNVVGLGEYTRRCVAGQCAAATRGSRVDRRPQQSVAQWVEAQQMVSGIDLDRGRVDSVQGAGLRRPPGQVATRCPPTPINSFNTSSEPICSADSSTKYG
jgi:hypothetical protein